MKKVLQVILQNRMVKKKNLDDTELFIQQIKEIFEGYENVIEIVEEGGEDFEEEKKGE